VVRFFLAAVDNKPEFGYGAPKTHEWRLPVHFLFWTIHPDGMYEERARLCKKHYGNDPVAEEECRVNAMAHPNVPGAEAYADKINYMLNVAWGAPFATE
jgi:hypothetical protein